MKLDDLLKHQETPDSVRRIAAAVEKIPSGEVLTIDELAALLGVHKGTIKNYAAHHLLKDHRFVLAGKRVWWGSKKTVAEARKKWRT